MPSDYMKRLSAWLKSTGSSRTKPWRTNSLGVSTVRAILKRVPMHIFEVLALAIFAGVLTRRFGNLISYTPKSKSEVRPGSKPPTGFS
jgi:hypothetical protein